ncbi:MAG: hypothetical protein ABI867_10590 [Kofleriaceae bacterium]
MTGHLDDTTFERLAMRELDGAARAQALAHITGCPRCAAIQRTLLDVEAGAREARLAGVPVTRPRRAWLWTAGAAVAAAAVLVVWFARRPTEIPVVRGGSAAIVLAAPSGDVHAPVELTWEPTGATGYRASVFDADGRVVWTRDVAAPPVRWPAEVPATAASYRWKVEALDGSAVVEESPLGAFRIVP